MQALPPDELEIARAQKQGGQALERVLEKTSRYVFALCVSWCRPPIDPSDVAQDSLIKIAKNITKFENKSAFFSWVYSVAYRTFLDAARKEKRRVSLASPEPLNDEIPVQSIQEDDFDVEFLIACLEKLEDNHREILLMIDIQELPYQQVADALKIPIGTVRSRVARARLALKKILEKSGTYSTTRHVLPFEDTQ